MILLTYGQLVNCPPVTSYLSLNTHFPLLLACFFLLTSYLLLLTSYFLLLTSYFLLLTSYFLLLASCFSLLNSPLLSRTKRLLEPFTCLIPTTLFELIYRELDVALLHGFATG